MQVEEENLGEDLGDADARRLHVAAGDEKGDDHGVDRAEHAPAHALGDVAAAVFAYAHRAVGMFPRGAAVRDAQPQAFVEIVERDLGDEFDAADLHGGVKPAGEQPREQNGVNRPDHPPRRALDHTAAMEFGHERTPWKGSANRGAAVGGRGEAVSMEAL